MKSLLWELLPTGSFENKKLRQMTESYFLNFINIDLTSTKDKTEPISAKFVFPLIT
jgi:hypothetical protein